MGATIVPVESGYPPFNVTQGYLEKHRPQPGGYYVLYDDGYQSWSPAEAFENGYTSMYEPTEGTVDVYKVAVDLHGRPTDMARDPDCEGALTPGGAGDVALFATAAEAWRAIEISRARERLYDAQGKADWKFFTGREGRNPRVVRASLLQDPATRQRLLRSMRCYGGSFSQALAAAIEVADSDHQQRIEQTFPELLIKYAEMGQDKN